MILPGRVVHVCRYGIKLFRVRICVCAHSYGCAKRAKSVMQVGVLVVHVK